MFYTEINHDFHPIHKFYYCIEVGDIPEAIVALNQKKSNKILFDSALLPESVINAPAILTEFSSVNSFSRSVLSCISSCAAQATIGISVISIVLSISLSVELKLYTSSSGVYAVCCNAISESRLALNSSSFVVFVTAIGSRMRLQHGIHTPVTKLTNLTKVQRRAARSVSNNYRNKTPGCVTAMVCLLQCHL
jgi:hypothetical protein